MNPTTCMCNNYKTLDWLKELSVEQCRQVIVDRQLIAVPEDGCHTVEVGGRWHKETILPWWSRGRASSMPNVSHWTTHLMGCHMGRVMDPLQKSLDPGGLEFRDLTNKSNGSSAGHGNVFSVCLFFLHKKGPQFLSENHLGAEFICNKQWDDSKKTKKKNEKESERTLFTISLWVCPEYHLDGRLFLISWCTLCTLREPKGGVLSRGKDGGVPVFGPCVLCGAQLV